MFDPVDPSTVYASFFARGIWRSNDTGTTWQQIMTPLGGGNNERAEFDVVALPNGNTRMYVGVGGGAGQPARFRRNDDVRNAAAATVQTGWLTLTSSTVNSPGYSSFGYCDPQCSYDNYVYVPPGADADTVYLSGDNEYNENDFVTGRSNGRAVLLSTDAGATFTDLTEDDRDDTYPGALHPDHHAIVTNPQNWKQFFDVGDGGISRSNGVFVDDSGDCGSAPKNYTGANRTFCELVLSRVPERLDAINEGLRTLHFYEINYNPNNPDEIAGGTQDNGSWETNGDHDTWVNTNVGRRRPQQLRHRRPELPHDRLAVGSDPGQLQQAQPDRPDLDQRQPLQLVRNEAVAFTATATNDPRQSGWLWTGREHVFRSTNFGLNPAFTKAEVLASCNVWNGDFDLDNNGVFNPAVDICDDWRALGNPGAAGRLTGATYGATLQGGHVAVVERTKADTSTLWAGTSTGRSSCRRTRTPPTPRPSPSRGSTRWPRTRRRATRRRSSSTARTRTTPGSRTAGSTRRRPRRRATCSRCATTRRPARRRSPRSTAPARRASATSRRRPSPSATRAPSGSAPTSASSAARTTRKAGTCRPRPAEPGDRGHRVRARARRDLRRHARPGRLVDEGQVTAAPDPLPVRPPSGGLTAVSV
jgi:hypothetical protein